MHWHPPRSLAPDHPLTTIAPTIAGFVAPWTLPQLDTPLLKQPIVWHPPAESSGGQRGMEAASEFSHVLVHGDLHEDQLLVVDEQLTGVLDWETGASTIRFGTSISASGELSFGVATGLSSRSCGHKHGSPMPSNEAWTPILRRLKQHFVCGMLCS